MGGALQVLRLGVAELLQEVLGGFGGLERVPHLVLLEQPADVGQHLDVRAADVLGRDEQDEQGRGLPVDGVEIDRPSGTRRRRRRDGRRRAALPCGIAIPLPMPVDIMASRLSTPARISPCDDEACAFSRSSTSSTMTSFFDVAASSTLTDSGLSNCDRIMGSGRGSRRGWHGRSGRSPAPASDVPASIGTIARRPRVRYNRCGPRRIAALPAGAHGRLRTHLEALSGRPLRS